MLIRLLREYLRPYRWPLVAVVGLQLIATLASLYLPSLNGSIIDDGVARGDVGYIWTTGRTMLLVSLAQIAATIAAVAVGAHVAMRFGRDLRSAQFRRVLSFSARELNAFGAPSLITRSTNDVQQVQMLVLLTCTMMVAAPITLVGGVVMALREDVQLSWLVAVAVPLLVLCVGLVISRMAPQFRVMQTRIDTINRVLREQITGIRVVRAFVRETHEEQRFGTANEALTDTATRVGRLMATMFPIVMLILNVSSVGVLWFGAARVESGEMPVGALFAFLIYLTQILMAVMMATFMLVLAPRAAVCAERITEVLRTDSSVVVPTHPRTDLSGHGRVSLRRVSFAYPGASQPVLCDVDLELRPGQTTAIIGSTGSGKTTLVSLIPRLFDATSGEVVVDGVPVTEVDPELLWSRIGLVPQKPFLFSGTVASNLRYGNPEADDDALWHALEVAQAADFVRAMPGGLDAPISQGGGNVSGGQRQRLSIARALVKRPGIYVFDDSFSALDVATDARLRAALAAEVVDAAVVIVAQRVSTIARADQIVVLEDGRVVGLGTHGDLLETCPTYAEIVSSQLSAEEAAA